MAHGDGPCLGQGHPQCLQHHQSSDGPVGLPTLQDLCGHLQTRGEGAQPSDSLPFSALLFLWM